MTASKRATASESRWKELESLVDERSRPCGVTVALDRRFAEGGERERLIHAIAFLASLFSNLDHLDLYRAPVLEPPRRACCDVPGAESGSKLERSQRQSPRVRIRLARDRALRGLDQRVRRLLGEILRGRALELRQELDRLVEVVGANLHELLARLLGEPLREARVVLRPRQLRHP